VRRRKFRDYEPFVRQIERWYEGGLLLREGVDPRKVEPRLELCSGKESFRLFAYCQLLQGIPTSPMIGRRMSWLVFEGMGTNKRLLGAVGLNSSVYSLGPRDSFLGWCGEDGERRKRLGLLCMMDMPICMALPPYTKLLGGKLVAALALTEEVNGAFVARYPTKLPEGGSLLALVTLCATGVHCPIFNRIMLKRGGLYKRIGVTSGFSTMFVSRNTVALARQVVHKAGKAPKGRGPVRSMRVVRRALQTCGIPTERLLRLGVRKGIYLGVADDGAIEMLRTSQFKG
jgi:hypothetical protein